MAEDALSRSSLDRVEREVVEALGLALPHLLGSRFVALWLYGSRARGAPRQPFSDVDLLVLVSLLQDADDRRVRAALWDIATAHEATPPVFSLRVRDAAWLADRRRIESFFVAEVDRDRIVAAGRAAWSPRDAELLEAAEVRLAQARTAAAAGASDLAASGAYYALLYAARAMLSARDLPAKTHSGVWHLVHRELVRPGLLDADLARDAAAAQDVREDLDYDTARATAAQAEDLLDLAERFVARARTLLEDGR